MAYDKLFEPIQIGPLEVKNRYAISPMNLMYNWEGLINEQEIAWYTSRAMGGTGMIIVGAYLSTEFGIPYQAHPFMYCWHIRHLSGLTALADHIHHAGATAIVQLLPVPGQHGGNWTGTQPVGPSATIDTRPLDRAFARDRPQQQRIRERVPKTSWFAQNLGMNAPCVEAREITVDELQTVIKQHAFGCRLAAYARWDGIEVHMCHVYLTTNMRDVRLNQRTDRYGGSEENRNRFLLELTEASVRVAKEENPNIVVGVRVDSEGIEGGFSFDETLRLAPQLQELGIDYWNLGCIFNREDGSYLRYARELKKVLKIPVITPSVYDPKLAERAVIEGQTDMISIGRGHLANADFANKIKEGREKDIIWCTKCGACHTIPGVRCVRNPEIDLERYNPKYQIWSRKM